MTIRTLPRFKSVERRREVESNSLFATPLDGNPDPLDEWDATLRPRLAAEGAVIDILDVIGEDPWSGGGVTLKSIKAMLDASSGPVTVNINSPGGDYFEGLAIYEALRAHSARVNVNVLGMAASAASIIAMAGNKVRIGKASFLMIHNCWLMAIGDRKFLAKVVSDMEKFDATAAGVYSRKSGSPVEEVAGWMDAESWFTGDEAVANGLADALLPSDAVARDPGAAAQAKPAMTLRFVDVMLARQGIPKSERRKMLNEIKGGTSGAAVPATQDAGLRAFADELRAMLSTLKA